MPSPNRRPPFDLITIGDSTLDVFLHIHEATVQCQLNKTQCLLCLEYAEKIPVERVVKVAGAGNASNAAVGATRLGLHTAIVSIVGRDEIGQEIAAKWKRQHISLKYVQIDPKRETNYSTVINFQGERTILVYSQPRNYVLPRLDGATWIYYSSLGSKHERLEHQLLRHLHTHPKQKLAFNPGTKQLHRGLEALKPVIKRSDFFILNREESIRLLEDGDRPIHNMLMSFHHLGAKIAVITDGPNGSYATDGKKIWFCPIFPGPIMERTGAGDSYATGFMCALFEGLPVPEAMRHGTANGWSVVQKIGPQAGLLTSADMRKVIKKFSRIQPRVEK